MKDGLYRFKTRQGTMGEARECFQWLPGLGHAEIVERDGCGRKDGEACLRGPWGHQPVRTGDWIVKIQGKCAQVHLAVLDDDTFHRLYIPAKDCP